jgi:hypothetical protein
MANREPFQRQGELNHYAKLRSLAKNHENEITIAKRESPPKAL